MMDHNRLIYIFLSVFHLVANGARSQHEPTKNPSAGSCPQEMCFYVFDRLEEETLRWRNLEEAFKRTLTLLTAEERLTHLSEALKVDPVIASLLDTPEADSYSTPDLMTDSFSLFQQKSNPHFEKRTKRQTDNTGILTPSERLAEALRWAKHGLRGTKPQVDQQQTESQARMLQDPDVLPTISNEKIPEEDSSKKDLFNGLPKAFEFEASEFQRKPRQSFTNQPQDSGIQLSCSSTQDSINGSQSLSCATQQFVRDAIGSLQCAAKCALAQRNEHVPSENLGLLTTLNATLNPTNTLTIEFELRTCQKHFVALWIQLYERGFPIVYQKTSVDESPSSSGTLQVPKECLTKTGNTFSITLPSEQEFCSFPLMDVMECKVYNVEMIPIYQGFQGQSSIVEITVPPIIPGDSTSLSSLAATSHQYPTAGVDLKWSIQSGDCAQLVTSVDVRIYDEGRANSSEPLRNYTLSSDCITKELYNRFSIGNQSNSCYNPTGLSLEMCRSYTLEMQAEYSSTWKGQSSLVDFFIDGRDASRCCYLHSSSSGSFTSVDQDGKFDCTWLISVQPNSTIWLMFSQFQIEGYYYHVKVYDGPHVSSNLMLDHSGSQPPEPVRSNTNKMLVQLAHNYYANQGYGKSFTASYTSVQNTGIPYASGCGGYIKIGDGGAVIGKGTFSKPANPSTETSLTECLWFIEKSNPAHTIVLNNPSGKSAFPTIVYDGWSVDGRVIYNQPGNTSLKAAIYSSSLKTLIKFPSWNSMDRDIVYSWNVEVAQSKVNGMSCVYSLTSPTGTIKSPNYPSSYPNLIDCRWIIQADSASKIRLTFGYVDTVADYDFITIYDGSSDADPVLYEISGSMTSNPQSITSSSNVMTVRFNTNSNIPKQYDQWGNYNYNQNQNTKSGFLGTYSTVSCDKNN